MCVRVYVWICVHRVSVRRSVGQSIGLLVSQLVGPWVSRTCEIRANLPVCACTGVSYFTQRDTLIYNCGSLEAKSGGHLLRPPVSTMCWKRDVERNVHQFHLLPPDVSYEPRSPTLPLPVSLVGPCSHCKSPIMGREQQIEIDSTLQIGSRCPFYSSS